jgi:aspartokinase
VIKVTEILRKVLKKYPLYAEALGHGIVNYSALTRILKKEIQHERMEVVSNEAIAIALKRSAEEQKWRVTLDKSVQPVNSITIRPHISVVSFEKSPRINAIHKKMLQYAERRPSSFLQFDYGMGDVNFVINEELTPDLIHLAKEEKLLVRFDHCSLITINMPYKSLDYPGVCARFFRSFAWEQINLITFFHTYGELSFVVEEKDAKKTYEIASTLAKI